MTSRAPIFLVRHGETEWNRARRYQGWLDSPLTPEGIAQAEAIGRLLSRLPEAAEAEIVASPLGRARHTAAIIAACLTAAVEDVSRYPHPSLPRKRGRVREGVRASDVSDSASAPPGASDRDGRPRPIRLDERLREISLGSWDGLAKRDIRRRAPDLFTGEESRWEWYFRSPDGETYDAFAGRIAAFLADLGEAPVIAVCHGVVTRVLRGLHAGMKRDAALRLAVPQDRIFRLADGTIEEIPA